MTKEEKIDAILEKIDYSKKREICAILNSERLLSKPSIIDEYYQMSQKNELGVVLPIILYTTIISESKAMQFEEQKEDLECITNLSQVLETISEEGSQQNETLASDGHIQGQSASAFVTPYNASLASSDNQQSSNRSNRRSPQERVSSSSKKSAEEIRLMR